MNQKIDWAQATFSSISNDIPLSEVEFITVRQYARDQLMHIYVDCAVDNNSDCWVDYHLVLNMTINSIKEAFVWIDDDKIRVVLLTDKIDNAAVDKGLAMLERVPCFKTPATYKYTQLEQM